MRELVDNLPNRINHIANSVGHMFENFLLNNSIEILPRSCSTTILPDGYFHGRFPEKIIYWTEEKTLRFFRTIIFRIWKFYLKRSPAYPNIKMIFFDSPIPHPYLTSSCNSELFSLSVSYMHPLFVTSPFIFLQCSFNILGSNDEKLHSKD